MPKGKRKVKGAFTKSKGDTSDDESFSDNASNITSLSDNKSTADDAADEEELTQEEVYEEKMKEAIDGLSLKSLQSRLNALNSVAQGLTKKIVPEFVSDRRMTLTDAIERSLKKGRGSEQEAAGQLAMLVCFQLAELAVDMKINLCPLLQALSRDASVQSLARAKCCSAIGIINFLAEGDANDILQPMQNLEAIFSGSYLKGNGIAPTLTAEEQSLHASAISAWSLLLTLVAPSDVFNFMSSANENQHRYLPLVSKLGELLESSSLEVRMAAGECICLAYEIGREHDIDFESDSLDDLCETLKELANDSHKYRAKKDRKTQRATFREILGFIEEDISPEVQIKFGQEALILDSWCRKKQYDAICAVLGSGMNLHLAENLFLRDIFNLGDRISLLNSADLKQSKHDRHLANAAAFKYRTMTRGKNRDKRSAVIPF